MILATSTDWSFDVMRKGSRIGEHRVRFRPEGDVLIVNIALEVAVGLWPIARFRYTHTAREIWHDDQFQSLESETSGEGKRVRVSANRTAENVIVESSSAGRAVLASDAIPLTHWNVLCLQRPLFSPQEGTPIAARFDAHGEETVSLADGSKVPATRYSLMLKPALYNWYDRAGAWTSLSTEGLDGSTIRYRRAR
jgi:Family of unknown function (DUF6134)